MPPTHESITSAIARVAWLTAGAVGVECALGAPWYLPAATAVLAPAFIVGRVRSLRERRASDLRAIERAVGRLSVTTVPTARSRVVGAAEVARAAESDATGHDDADLMAVGNALATLARHVDESIKDGAKKGRNLAALIDAVDEPLLATGEGDRVLFCNRSADLLFGESFGTLNGRLLSEVLANPTLLEMHRAARGGTTRRGRIPLTTLLGRRVFQVSASPVPAAWGTGIFGAVLTLRDVTELDLAVQIKSDFVANASHELRTPVTAVRLAAETLRDCAADDPVMARRLIEVVASQAERLEEMVRDLLDLSRLESSDVPVRIEQVDLEAVAAELTSMFEGACAARSLSLRVRLDPSRPRFATDRRLVVLILRNLLENAVKFAREGTEVEVDIATGSTRPDDRMAEAWLRLEVRDRGIGIPVDLQERVFERYFQVDPARTSGDSKRGSGLGLAIVKHAAQAMGGTVRLESVWGSGTTVRVDLPAGRLGDRMIDETVSKISGGSAGVGGHG